MFRRVLKPVGAAAGVAALVLLGAAPASAHVTVSSDTTEAGEYALMTFAVPHGCADSPTTEVHIELPGEGIGPVTPSVNPNWEVQRVRDADENVTAVTYTAKEPLAADVRDAFDISTLILPDAEGDLLFPVTQICEEGEEAWDEVAADGEDPHDLEHPAPFLTVTHAEGAGDGETAPSGPSTLAWVNTGLAGTALVLAIVALTRRSSSAA